jgi:hypothetical protein
MYIKFSPHSVFYRTHLKRIDTNFHEIFCEYLVELSIVPKLFFNPLSVMGGPP